MLTGLSSALLRLHVHPPKGVVWVAVVGALATITYLDSITPPDYAFSIFYLFPVVFAAWALGRPAGLVVAVAAGLTRGLAVAASPDDPPTLVLLWNPTMQTLINLGAALAVVSIANLLEVANARASIDPLTGLWNRRRFYEEVELELARARRADSPFALVYIDVDGLKECNDGEGHEAGDRLLVEFADLSREQLRSTDLLARLGGDEFAFFLPGVEPAEVELVVARLLDAYRSAPRPIGVSAGVVTGTASAGCDVEALVRASDRLMYEIKQAGGDGYRVAGLQTQGA